jgi:membrane-bound serine protease (ClpP class)
LLVGVTTLLTVGYYWFAIRKIIESQRMISTLDPALLINQFGEVRTDIDPIGTVFVSGELWSAESKHPITSGARIRVVSRNGLSLIVVPQKIDSPSSLTEGEN